MTGPEKTSWLRRVYSARSREELAAHYDAWASEYDRDLTSWGYLYPALAAAMTARYLRPGDGTLLDAACGTGIVGQILTLLGYTDIVGIDISDAMLAEARRKRVYREVRNMALGEPLDFPDDRFACVLAIGVFTVGHAPPDSLDEILRATRPGGHVVFSLSDPAYREGGFREKIAALEGSGRWFRRDESDNTAPLPGAPEAKPGRILVYQAAPT
ncbi:MAG: class I SAM-dependent DNA methyltransferase [Alphaproteobacteria bacterium]